MGVRWVENYTSVTNLMKILAKEITNGGTDTNWKLESPTDVSSIDRLFVLSRTIGMGAGEKVFLEFYRPEFLTTDSGGVGDKNNFYMECRFGTDYTVGTESNVQGEFKEDCGSLPSRFSWFKSNTESNIKAWLPVQYWLSINEWNISLVLAGDPSANFDDRLVSFAYFGQIKPFENSVVDEIGNFGICTSSDISPYDYLSTSQLNTYSDLTGTGVTDFTMLKTSTGFPFQSHVASFTTPDEFANKKFEGPSNYTKKYHMSPVYIIHGYDGYRGELQGVVASDRSSIVNFDEMIHKDFDNNVKNTYKVFMVNAPHSILNNSTNVLYAIALLLRTDTLTDTPVVGASLTESTVDLAVLKTYQLGVNILPLDATVKTVTWSSDSSSVATVDANGKVTTVAIGTTTIKATTTDGGKIASCILTVTAV